MSHQVKLAELVFEDLDLLKKAIQDEGLTITDDMYGYGLNWRKGQNYTGLGKKQTLEFGISAEGAQSKCGIVCNEDGTYELVGDTWGVRYKTGSLEVLGSCLSQRYRLGQVRKVASAQGWNVVEAPTELLGYGTSEKATIILQPQRKTIAIGALA